MAVGFYITQAIAQSIATAVETALDAGAAAQFNIYNGTTPADADATESNTILAKLTCTAASIASKVDDTPGVLMTFAAISSNTVANSGTATHFRILTADGGTVCCQGTVGTVALSFDLVLNTDVLSSGSNISISAATIFVPEGP